MEIHTLYHPGQIGLYCGLAKEEAETEKVKALTNEMHEINQELKTISKFIDKLTHAKEDKKANFTEDEEVRGWIDQIREKHPTAFGKLRYEFDSEEKIDNLIRRLEAVTEPLGRELSFKMSMITQQLQDRSHLTDSLRKILDESKQLIDTSVHNQK